FENLEWYLDRLDSDFDNDFLGLLKEAQLTHERSCANPQPFSDFVARRSEESHDEFSHGLEYRFRADLYQIFLVRKQYPYRNVQGKARVHYPSEWRKIRRSFSRAERRKICRAGKVR